MIQIPLEATPNQQFSVVLNGQPCTIKLYQRGRALFMDLSVSGEAVRAGMICQKYQRILQYKNVGFSGDFIFDDLKDGKDPIDYSELESRYILYYLTEDELDEL